jgi:virginiamycin B lyase
MLKIIFLATAISTATLSLLLVAADLVGAGSSSMSSRPTGRATHVIFTEYGLPRPTIWPYDVIVDREGMVWYSSFGEQTLGELDPKTGKVTEHPVPVPKPGFPIGMISLRNDQDGNLWLGMMYQGAIAKCTSRAEKFEIWSLPPDLNRANPQITAVSPQRHAVDGKVWMINAGITAVQRLDLASGKFETFEPFRGSPKVHNIYDVIADSQNNAYFTDLANGDIGRIDGKTAKITLYAMTPGSGPGRGMMDPQDRLWFGEYRRNGIGMFDTRTERFQEWLTPKPWTAPYDIALDKNGEVWTGSMLSDRVLRLDPKTGQFTEYLLPKSTNVRRVFVDNSTTPVTLWIGINHGAFIIKLEPLD